MPLPLSAFSSDLSRVICGQQIGRECDTQPVSNCRSARVMAIRSTWSAQIPIMKVAADVRNPQTTEGTSGSDMVAEGTM